MKVSIYGAAGLLGDALVRKFKLAGCEVFEFTRVDVDLSDAEALLEHLSSHSVDLILNASGMTGLEACLDQPEVAHKVNVLAPAAMASHCAAENIQLVHFSTDYVFDAVSPGYLTEDDAPNPLNKYGETKLSGELEVLSNHSSAMVCRVSWLFGHGRASFVDQVVSNTMAAKPHDYISDKWSVPNFADDLAEMCFELVAKKATGVIHLCSAGDEVTWHEYALAVQVAIAELGHSDANLVEPGESKLDEVAAFRAKRPRYTSLKSNRLTQEFGIDLPDWKLGLRRYLADKL